MSEQSEAVLALIHQAIEENGIAEINYPDQGCVAMIVPKQKWDELLADMERHRTALAKSFMDDSTFQDLIVAYRANGQDEFADEMEALIASVAAGELQEPELSVRINALLAKGMESVPGMFTPELAQDPDEELRKLAGNV